MTTETKEEKAKRYTFKAEMKQLLHLIVHSLYTHQEIFLRELISNASDALNKARFRKLTDTDILSKDAPLEIRITLDEAENTLAIEDTGIGMTRDDLVKRLGTVASSGTKAFLEQLQKEGKPIDGQLIGQFGVGFYSAFMVAEQVVVETRSAEPDSEGLRWTSDGEGSFTIDTVDRAERGTKITLKLRDDAKEFTRDYRVRSIVQKYSNFVDFPIKLGEEQVNTVKALWHKNKSDITAEELNEFYKFISGDYQEPLGHLHLNLEGVVNVRALLFIPQHAPPAMFREDEATKLHLYANNVFIQDDCKALVPDYLRFMRGVVETDNLPLNVSREVTQNSPVMAKIRSILTGKILGLLEGWASKEEDTYNRFFREFGPLFKMGIGNDFANKEKLTDLLRFESTQTGKGVYTSLAAYVDRMPADQTQIYYLLGEHRDVLERSPNLEYFRKNGIEVLLMDDPMDAFVVPHIEAFREKELKSIEKADIDLKTDDARQKEALAGADADQLIARFKVTLGDRVKDVVESRRLVDSAVTLVVGESGMDVQMERMMRMMDKNFKAGARILEINTAHPLMKNLRTLLDSDPETADKVMLQLYEGALLLEGGLTQTTDYVARMTELLVKATA
ncbi:MAG: molecular chaperone HtpG [Rhodothermales bacterium]